MGNTKEKRLSKEILMVAGKYKVGRMLGAGSFGELCEGKNLEDGEPVAIKFELRDKGHPQLPFEYMAYKKLNKDGGAIGIPRLLYFKDIPGHPVHALVMELLGPSLENLFNKCDRRFSMKTTLLIARQLVERIEFVHSRGIINRDIKPDNFLIGRPGTEHARTIYIIDFGLCKEYVNAEDKHIARKTGLSPLGTIRYMPINCHRGITMSRRDDLEAIGFALVYFFKGELPWQGVTGSPEERNKKILRIKEQETPEKLCSGMPSVFVRYFRYVRELEFAETPDYTYLRALFIQAFKQEMYTDDKFDWEMRRRGSSLKASLLASDREEQSNAKLTKRSSDADSD